VKRILLPWLLGGVAWSAPLTLEEACQICLQAQPRLQVMQARVERSQAAEKESWTPWNPRLALDASYTFVTPSVSSSFFGQTTVFQPNQNYLATLRLTQLLWNGGLYANQAKVRQWQVAIQEERSRETRLQVEEEAALQFLQTKAASENVRLNQQQVVQRKAQQLQSKLLFDKGTVPRYDVMRSEAEVARAEQELVESQRQLQLRQSSLESLLQTTARELADLAGPVAPATDIPERYPLQERPDLKLAALALTETEARLEVARSENSPSLTLQTEYNQRTATVASPSYQWNTGVAFSWPLYDQGISSARAEQAEAELRELQAQAREVERLAKLEIEQLHTDVATRYQAWKVADKQCAVAHEAQRVATVRYENGLSTQVERLDAELNYTRALRDRINVRYELAQAQCRLKRALGLSQQEKDIL
jgi:outer membrane protein